MSACITTRGKGGSQCSAVPIAAAISSRRCCDSIVADAEVALDVNFAEMINQIENEQEGCATNPTLQHEHAREYVQSG